MMEQEIAGIVLSVSEYREKDALITILTDRDMKIRFVVYKRSQVKMLVRC